jgi:lipoprotein-anchoring transpeptidase ErfK/SrfK
VVAAAPQLQRRSRSNKALAASAVTLLLALSAPVMPTAGAGSGTPGNDAKGAHAVKSSAPQTVQLPHRFGLTNANVARWAGVMRPVLVHRSPSDSAPVVTQLETTTTDKTTNVVLVLGGIELKGDQTWYRVRLPILPNNSTGWVPARALGALQEIDTHLYIDRASLTATLKRDGVTVFTTTVGVGRSVSPTPRGEYYIVDRVSGFDDPVYGPVAFGTSARSATLTDWPGGGVVGVHGTNEPRILPGRVSHGCIRMRNASILKLARLMQVGTPLTIS